MFDFSAEYNSNRRDINVGGDYLGPTGVKIPPGWSQICSGPVMPGDLVYMALREGFAAPSNPGEFDLVSDYACLIRKVKEKPDVLFSG